MLSGVGGGQMNCNNSLDKPALPTHHHCSPAAQADWGSDLLAPGADHRACCGSVRPQQTIRHCVGP